MAELPSGTVTFLFTDLEGSTRLWEEHPDGMRAALARHDEILRTAVEKHGGHVVKTTGDGLHAAFSTAHDTVAVAIEAQRVLTDESWPLPESLLVRMGLHTGEADLRDGDYYGTAVNRAARIAAVAHGGQIVCSRATEELIRDGLEQFVEALDLGDHQLRDLARPEHVFQVRANGLRRDFPPLRSLDAFPGNLPLRPTSFIGRDADVDKAASALERSPIVTITGVGGVGKTRLALHVAAEVLPHYPEGAWFCELAAADSPTALLQIIASTIGAPIRGEQATDNIIDFLKTKRLLLVLDNCEHLIEAAGRLAERVIGSCPEVRVLATSREGLAVDGEQVLPLRSLATDTRGASDDSLAAAVRLFVERARAARPDIDLSGDGMDAAAEICRRLDGIPLAIELAAARVVGMAPSQIAGLLDERFRLLTGGRRTAVERHQTLRATVDWSYSLLDERERAVFDRLGVFAGTFSAEAAGAVTSGTGIEMFDVLDVMTSLVAKSLVQLEADSDNATRYSLLETIRQYTRERLDEAGASDEWRRRHARYFAELAEQLGPLLLSADEFAIRHQISAESDNFRAAVAWALDRGDADDRELGVRIPAALYNEANFCRATGVADWAIRALPFVNGTTPRRRHEIRSCVAQELFMRADMDTAREVALAALDEAVPDDVVLCIDVHLSLAGVHAMQGDLDRALAVYDDAFELMDERDSPDVVRAMALGILAMYRLGNGDFDRARADAEKAVPLARRSRNPSTLAMATFAMGWALCRDEPETAIAMLTETIALCRDGAIDSVLSAALCQRALLRFGAGDLPAAAPEIGAAFRRSVEVGDQLSVGASAAVIAAMLALTGDVDAATITLGAIEANVIPNFMIMGFRQVELDLDALHADLENAMGQPLFDRARLRGATMTYEEATAFVRLAIDDLVAVTVT